MDPFEPIPSEIRVEILCQCNSLEDVKKAIRASPALLNQAIESWREIYQAWLTHQLFLDESILQDALAILLFPKIDRHDPSCVETVANHLQLWGSSELSEPQDKEGRQELRDLCNCLIKFAEDYLAKATSQSPALAYRNFSFLTENPHCPRFSIDALYPSEKSRLLRAFLRYELICKINYVRDWTRLNPQGNPPAWLDEPLHELLSHVMESERSVWTVWDTEALHCIYDYVDSLYCAALAYDHATLRSALGGEMTWDFMPYRELYFSWVPFEEARSLITGCGLDMAANLTMRRSMRDETVQAIKQVQELILDRTLHFPGRHVHNEDARFCLPALDWVGGPGLGGSVYDRYLISELHPIHGAPFINGQIPDPRNDWHRALQIDLYRRAAWVFFDDDRHFPDEGVRHFPSRAMLCWATDITAPRPGVTLMMELLMNEYEPIETWPVGANLTRELKRSMAPFWHDRRREQEPSE